MSPAYIRTQKCTLSGCHDKVWCMRAHIVIWYGTCVNVCLCVHIHTKYFPCTRPQQRTWTFPQYAIYWHGYTHAACHVSILHSKQSLPGSGNGTSLCSDYTMTLHTQASTKDRITAPQSRHACPRTARADESPSVYSHPHN